MKICINEEEVFTDKTLVQHHDLYKLYANPSLCSEENCYHVFLEINDNYWDDLEVPIEINLPNALITLKEGMKFKVFPKASFSNRGMYIT